MQNEEKTFDFPVPAALKKLVAEGIWPGHCKAANAQELKSSVDKECIRAFAPDESQLFLYPPPFGSVAKEAESNQAFWRDYGALDQIVGEKVLIIGDFGLGSDTAIGLDYSKDLTNPKVIRLCWRADGSTTWVLVAVTFDQFAWMLGFTK